MSEIIHMNQTLLNLIIYILDTKSYAISKGVIFQNIDWYEITQDAFYSINNDLFERAGIKHNTYNFEKIVNYKLPDGIQNVEYSQLGQFIF